MPSTQRESRRSNVESRLSETLGNFNLDIRRCGRRAPDSVLYGIDMATGFWADRSYTSKATRWLIHLVEDSGTLRSRIPTQPNGNRLGFFNAASVNIACLTVRVVPVAQLGPASFMRCDDWEWLLWFLFHPPLASNNSSVSLEEYDPATGAVQFGGQNQPYAAAGLVMLCDPGASLPANPALPAVLANATYSDASSAVAALLQVAPILPVAATGGTP